MRHKIASISLLIILLVGLISVYSAQAAVEPPPDDGTPTSTPTNSTPAPDSDGDGVPNATDECPTVAGSQLTGGCPDRDWDGTRDSQDSCPNDPGPIWNGGCPIPIDNDGDGVPNVNDSCPYDPGPASNNGCPVSTPEPDNDGDGIPNASDSCPNNAGPASNNGCPVSTPPPDNDGDGIPNASDSCPNQAGPAWNNGCPLDGDSDGDGVLNDDDDCPNIPGPASNYGCPISTPVPDDDGDGVPNTQDNCPNMTNPDQADLDSDGIGDACDDENNVVCLDGAHAVGALSCLNITRECSQLVGIEGASVGTLQASLTLAYDIQNGQFIYQNVSHGVMIPDSIRNAVASFMDSSMPGFNAEGAEYGWLVNFIFTHTIGTKVYDVLVGCGELLNFDDNGTPQLVRPLNSVYITPRETPTSTPTPTPTSTPTNVFIVTESLGVRIRDNYGNHLITVPQGQAITVIGITPPAEQRFIKVTYTANGQTYTGFMYYDPSWYSNDEQVGSIPITEFPQVIVVPPPDITPTPTPPPANIIRYEGECINELSNHILSPDQINALINYIDSANFKINVIPQSNPFGLPPFHGIISEVGDYIGILEENDAVESVTLSTDALRNAIKASIKTTIENAINTSSASLVGGYIIHYQYNASTNQVTMSSGGENPFVIQPSFRGATVFSADGFLGRVGSTAPGALYTFTYEAIGTRFSANVTIGGSISGGVNFIAQGQVGFDISISMPINIYLGPVHHSCSVTTQDLINHAQ